MVDVLMLFLIFNKEKTNSWKDALFVKDKHMIGGIAQ